MKRVKRVVGDASMDFSIRVTSRAYAPCQVRASSELKPARVGSKAASLHQLMQAGFAVPEWGVLPTTFFDEFLESTGLTQAIHEILLRASACNDSAAFDALEEDLHFIRSQLLDAQWSTDLKEELQRIAKPLLTQGKIAIRSSGTMEDLQNASFAGQYLTVLKVADLTETQQAVQECWASAFEKSILQYAVQQGADLSKYSMAVILQSMVHAQCAGVAFSVNPMTGLDNQILIEACRGLGNRLVDGKVVPTQYLVDWLEADEPVEVKQKEAGVSSRPLLEKQARELARTCVKIQALVKQPVDMEWAFDGKCLWVLQARPITRVYYHGIKGEWTTADLKDGGVSSSVCTPLMASLYQRVFCESLPRYLNEVGLRAHKKEELPWMQQAFGRLYWNVGHVKSRLQALPGFCEREFDEDLGIEPAYKGAGITTAMSFAGLIRGLRAVFLLNRSFKARIRVNKRRVKILDRRLCDYEVLKPEALNDWDLSERAGNLLGLVQAEIETAYFRTIYDNSNAQTLFKESLKKLQSGRGITPTFELNGLDLLVGLENLSHLRPLEDEIRLAKELWKNPKATGILLEKTEDELFAWWKEGRKFHGKMEIAKYIRRYGYLGPHTLELLSARWEEDPRPVFVSLKRHLRDLERGKKIRLHSGQQQLKFRKAFLVCQCLMIEGRFKLPWKLHWKRFQKSLATIRRLLWWREEMRVYSTRVYFQIRRYCLELGKRFEQVNELDDPEDVFFLKWYELRDWCLSGRPPQNYRESIRKRRQYYSGFSCYTNPDELGSRYQGQITDGTMPVDEFNALQGTAGSPGRRQGVARVVSSLAEAGRLQEGDILITRFTDPGWTTYFHSLAGVVTETGGVLSHAAVIARECGFPAVLAMQQATSRIPDGALIEIDGDRGSVQVLQAEDN